MRHSCWRRLLLRLQEPRPLTESAARSVSYVAMAVAACGATHSAVTSSLTIRSSRCRFAARLNSSVRLQLPPSRNLRGEEQRPIPSRSVQVAIPVGPVPMRCTVATLTIHFRLLVRIQSRSTSQGLAGFPFVSFCISFQQCSFHESAP